MQRTPIVVGVTGYATAGKDTTAAAIAERLGCKTRAFADNLRELVAYVNPVVGAYLGSVTPVVEPTVILVRYNEAIREHGYTEAKRRYPLIREMLVGVGGGARRFIAKDVWLSAVLPPGYAGEDVVVSDVRYEDEARKVKELGGVVVKVERPGVVAPNEEERESIPRIVPDYVIHNDGTLEQLRARAVEVADRIALGRCAALLLS